MVIVEDENGNSNIEENVTNTPEGEVPEDNLGVMLIPPIVLYVNPHLLSH